MRVICLSSGGIDSSTILFMLKEKAYEIYPLYVDYGHKSSNVEIKSLRSVCKKLKIMPKIIRLKDLSTISSGLTTSKISPIDNPYFPNRNLLLLTIAAAYAHGKSIKVISIGLLNNIKFPDQTKDFLLKAEESISISLGYTVKILAPLIELNKHEVVILAKKHHVPLKLTYSCYAGKKKPCGKCKACLERDLAMSNDII